MATRTGKKTAAPQVRYTLARPEPIVLISGKEATLADRARRIIRDTLTAEDPSIEVQQLTAKGYSRGALALYASPSLFMEPKLVFVDTLDEADDELQLDLLAYLEAPIEGATVVVRHTGGMRGKRVLDAIRAMPSGAVEIVCDELKYDTDRAAFVRDEVKLAGRRISPGAVRDLTAIFGERVNELAGAVQQLIDTTSGEITEATVDDAFGGRIETTAFKIADACLAGDVGHALVLTRHALAGGASEIAIVAAFASKLRMMAMVHRSSGTAGQLASRIGANPRQLEFAMRDSRNWSEQGLGNAIRCIAETDAMCKGAASDRGFALERMIRVLGTRGVHYEPALTSRTALA